MNLTHHCVQCARVKNRTVAAGTPEGTTGASQINPQFIINTHLNAYMDMLKLTHNGKPLLINGDKIITAAYIDEDQLVLKLDNGETVTFRGDEAVDAWTLVAEGASALGGGDAAEADADTDPFEGVKRDIQALELKIKRKAITGPWEAEQLRDAVEYLADDWDAQTRKRLAEELASVKAVADEIADLAEIMGQHYLIDECANKPIATTQASKSILARLNSIEAELHERNKLSDEFKTKIRVAKERVAWYRAKKKLDDANVALAGGNYAKAEKLKREASILIKQDWSEMWPDEDPPAIEVAAVPEQVS